MRRFLLVPFCFCWLVASGCVSEPTGAPSDGPAPVGKVDLSVYENLSRDEMRDTSVRLKKEKKFATLRAIAMSSNTHADSAAEILALQMNAPETLRFCRDLPFNSSSWRSAFGTLRNFPKRGDVLEYLREIAATEGVLGRYYCYNHCAASGWDDFSTSAVADLSNIDFVVLPNAPPLSIAHYAKRYLTTLERRN